MNPIQSSHLAFGSVSLGIKPSSVVAFLPNSCVLRCMLVDELSERLAVQAEQIVYIIRDSVVANSVVERSCSK